MDSQAAARTELAQEIDQLLSAAMEARPTVTEFLHREKERLDFQLDDSHAVKMRESLMRKAIAILGREDVAGRYAKELVWNSPHADMVDALRYRIITSAERYVSTIEAITADLLCSCKAKSVRGWNFWLTDNSYVAINDAFAIPSAHSPNGWLLFEIQFHTEESMACAQRTHDWYHHWTYQLPPEAHTERKQLMEAAAALTRQVPRPPRVDDILNRTPRSQVSSTE